jgi:YidC/Oxa1 family membrane protein insertase
VNQDNRNFFVFAVLAVVLLFGWPWVMQRIFPQPPVPTRVAKQAQVQAGPSVTPGTSAPAKLQDLGAVLKSTPRIRVETPELQGSINLKGARIDDLVLPRFRETVWKNSPPIRLFSPSGAADAYFAGLGWSSSDGVQVPDENTVYTASAPVLRPAQPVTLSWTNATGQRFAIRIAVDNNFMFTVQQSVANGGAKPVTVRPYALLSRAGASKDLDMWTNHVGPIGVFGNGADYDIGYKNLEGQPASFFGSLFGNSAKAGENRFSAKGGWIGFTDKFWLAALIPDQGFQVDSAFRAQKGTDPFQADFTVPPAQVAPGKAVSATTHIFAGAKEVKLLNDYAKNLQVTHFDKAIDWGWFEVIERPIFDYLHLLWKLVGNFGLAIILLTITIRALLFPIAQRQFASMARMRIVQPKMKAIQEKYKDDKARQQQELAAFYKEEKLNPLAGCLPTLLQIPIMYSLYKVLLLSTEMRHQPFVLWIKDLSAPDSATVLNLFGLLHFTPPSMLAIGVVPVLLGISMFFQMKLNPAPMDETQKQVFAIMPWMLMFVMAPFAVGLQIYWITSNCLTILQQQWLYSRHPALKQAPAK